MEKRYKFRIYPTAPQELQIKKNFGCVRFIYNYYLNKRIEAYKEDKGILTVNECCRDLTALKKTDGYEWLQEVDDNSLRSTIKELDLAYKKFFRNIKKGDTAPGFPKFKNRKQTKLSYKSKNNSTSSRDTHCIEIYENEIKLPKLGLVKCKVSRKTEGRILSAAILKVPSGKYFVSVCCTEVEPPHLPKTGAEVGIQMGVKNLAVTSDGKQFENHRFYEKTVRKIARLQREMSRKSIDSNNREKARLKLACMYERLNNQKTDILQKITTQLVREYDVICVRDNQLKKMAKNRLFAKYLADAGWGTFAAQLEYKCNWYGKNFVKVSSLHPSAQICSSCGELNNEMKIKKHLYEWECSICGAHHNRSVNAAVNILREGNKILLGKQEFTPAENM